LSINGTGTYSLPQVAFINGSVMDATLVNSDLSDIGSEMTNSIAKDGQTTATANLPMGGFKHTNVANGTARTDYASLGQAQDNAADWLTTVVGVDVITALSIPAFTIYTAGQTFRFISAGANTTNVTLNINSLGAKAITKSGTTALVAGNISSGAAYEVVYDGTQFQLIGIFNGGSISKGINTSRSSITQNATTMDLFALSNTIDGTGSAVTITAIANAPQAGATRTLYPITSTVIVNNAMFALDGGANYTTQAGDKVEFEAITISTYKVHITKANGAAMTGAGEYFYWPIGSTPVYGLSCNGAAVSRTVYQALFGIIGTVFGVGDGSTTFNIPNIPADYSFVQASANEASSTVGQVLAHTHGILQYQATGGGASAANATATGAVTTTTSAQTPAGGVANFAAGVRVRICIRF
jgi:microcystin-dependent protein